MLDTLVRWLPRLTETCEQLMGGMDDQKDDDIYSFMYAEGMPMILQMTQQTAIIPFLTLIILRQCRPVAL